ncbi:membrane protein [Oceanicola sp. 22II-s10i]|uniref:CopD family protein n=1 Tax=Oceanicola sp. 22II-s10i TaxID=1317116 RepID=UPI000B51F9D6|nr:CopD family protein [Oceanicola sp. 22II-s10i]OWU85981.1 membrane protein [Oceanicola sp. 22II-s10i]
MTDILASLYPWTKALHIVSVVAWMAGIFYLPRLFVYHAEKITAGTETDALFQEMERKLLRLIMNPSMIATWVFGLMLMFTPGIVDWGMVWPWTKAAGVVAMTWFHHWLGLRRKDFAAGRNSLPGRRYRMMNELPTLLLVLIVFSVVLKF